MVDSTLNSQLIRTNVWSQEIKDILQEQLQLDSYINWITDFPDGDTINIPTLSEMTVRNYSDGAQIQLDNASTGNFTLTIDKYYQTGISVPDKFKDDSFYVGLINSKFVPKLIRALMEQKESDIAHLQAGQTSADPNTINGVDHRYCGTGSSGVIAIKDVNKAKLALDKAAVSKLNRRAVVDPTVSYQLQQLDTVFRQDYYGSNTVIKDGFGTTNHIGMYGGFSWYESLFLDNALTETVVATSPNSGSVALTTGIANMFIGEEAFIGAMRAAPDMKDWYDGNRRSQVYHVTTRYGIKLYRSESLVTILTAA